jgi:hypothetical protein
LVLHKALDAIAQCAPGLWYVLADQQAASELILCLDGTLIYANAVATGKVTGHNDTDNSDDGPAYRTIGWVLW